MFFYNLVFHCIAFLVFAFALDNINIIASPSSNKLKFPSDVCMMLTMIMFLVMEKARNAQFM